MKRSLIAAALALAVISTADARPRQSVEQHGLLYRLFHPTPQKPAPIVRVRRHHAGFIVGRPAECAGIPWCGCWLRLKLGIHDARLNAARAWATVGTAAEGPANGVIAVWRHHVGIITGVPRPGWVMLLSGNDGHAVRERPRPTRGVIAYRRL
jgi:hypothetical protein